MFDPKKYIRSGDFCQIVSDKFADIGVKRNTLVYVVGTKAIPESEEDPYTQRIKMLVHLVGVGDHVNFEHVYIMDPNSIQKVDENKQEHLITVLEEDFKDERYATEVIGG